MRMTLLATIAPFLALLAAAPTAGAYTEQFGDFGVTDDFFPTGVVLFDQPNGATNPSPFPVPTIIDEAAVYPTRDAPPITVRQIRDRLASQGLNTDTFGVGLALGPRGSVTIANLQITAADQLLAISDGVETFESTHSGNAAIGFLPDLDLGSADPDAKVLISYNVVGDFGDVAEMELIGTPEPLSVIFFGTGLAAVAIFRARRRKV